MKIDLWKVFLFFIIILFIAYRIYPSHFEMAVLFEQSDMYYMAISELEQSLTNQVSLPALNKLAKLYETVGDIAPSIEHYKQIVRLNPDNYDAHLNLIRIFQWNRKPFEVEKEYERFFARIENNPQFSEKYPDEKIEILTALRNIYSYNAQWDKLIDSIEKLKQCDPSNEKYYNDLMDLYLRKRDRKMIASVSKEAYAKFSDKQDVMEKVAWVSYLIGNNDFSSEIYERLTAKYPLNKKYWIDYAVILKKMNDKKALSQMYKKMAEIFSADKDLLHTVAYFFVDNKQIGDALILYENLYNNLSPTPKIGFELADVYELNKQYEQALNLFLSIREQYYDSKIVTERIISLYLALKKYDQAESLIIELINDNPADKPMLVQLANIYEWNNLPAKAAGVYEQLHALEPDNTQWIKQLANNYLWADNIGKAENFLEHLLKIYPDDINYKRQAFSIYYARQNHKKAMLLGEEILNSGITDVSFLKKMSYLYFSGGQTDKMEKILLDIMKLEPDDLEAVESLALLYEEKGARKKAIAYYEKLCSKIGKEKIKIEWAASLSRLYIDDKDYKRAITFLQDNIRKNPANTELKKYLAEVFAQTKQYERALNLLDAMLADVSGDKQSSIIRMMAEVFSDQKDYLKAKELFERLLEKYPDDALIQKNLGDIETTLNNYNEAVKYYSAYLRKNPEDYNVHYALGSIYDGQGKDAKKFYHYKQALRFLRKSPNNPDNYIMYAHIYQGLGRYWQASWFYKKALAEKKDRPEILNDYIDFLIARKSYVKAFNFIHNLPDNIKSRPRTQMHLAAIYTETKQYNKALKIMAALTAQFPDNADFQADIAFIYNKLGRWDKSLKIYKDLLHSQPPAWSRYQDVKDETKSLVKTYAPQLKTGFLLVEDIKKDTQMYYSSFQMYITGNILLKTNFTRYFFHDSTVQGGHDVNAAVSETGIEIDYFLNKFLSVNLGPLMLNYGPKDFVTFNLGMKYNNNENFLVELNYAYNDKIVDPRAAVPLGGRMNHIGMKFEWDVDDVVKLMAEGIHGQYHFSDRVRRLGLHTRPGYRNDLMLGADISILHDPHLAFIYRFNWTDTHYDRNYASLLSLNSKVRSHQIGLLLEHDISDKISFFGTGFVANDDERDLFLKNMGSWGYQTGIRLKITDSIELGGSYLFQYENGIKSPPSRSTYLDTFANITF
ncbi:tetratricopeptide repeat protein [bacterium]|nr:tetratricopeptide repeat protein [bacterium]